MHNPIFPLPTHEVLYSERATRAALVAESMLRIALHPRSSDRGFELVPRHEVHSPRETAIRKEWLSKMVMWLRYDGATIVETEDSRRYIVFGHMRNLVDWHLAEVSALEEKPTASKTPVSSLPFSVSREFRSSTEALHARGTPVLLSMAHLPVLLAIVPDK